MASNGQIFHSEHIFGSSELSSFGVKHLINRPPQHLTATPAKKRLHEFGSLTIARLLNTPADQLQRYDIAEMNLVCGEGLNGPANVGIKGMLDLLDSWAKAVSAHTNTRVGGYLSNPKKHCCSLAEFKMTMMIGVLCRQIGIRYNPDRIGNPDNFDNPADSFLQGPLGIKRQGTCASLPVLLTAIGRRLGYPLKLVLAQAHCFCRWDSPTEKFNIEFNEKGLNSHPDSYYKKDWSPQIHEMERVQPILLTSLTPQQELAHFAHERIYFVHEAGRNQEALALAHVIYRLWPIKPHGIWVTHLNTVTMYPEKKWPTYPCEETTGPAAYERLTKDKRIKMVPAL